MSTPAPDGPSGRDRTPAALSLWAPLALSAAGYWALALWFPLLPSVGRVPTADIRTFAPSLAGGLLYAALLVALFLLFIRAARIVSARGLTGALARRPLAAILVAAAILALPLLLTYPINATDVYRYVVRGRIASVYGESAFTYPPQHFATDPFLPLAGEWAGETSPYGPLWEVVAAGVTAVTGDNLLLGVLAFKALALGAFLASGALVWSILGLHARVAPASRAAYTLLWAWNPALLLVFAVNGHNDALMLFGLLLGLWLGWRGRPALGFSVMVLAALTKPVAVLALPFFFLGFWRAQPGTAARLRFAAVAVVAAVGLAWLSFLPWSPPGDYLAAPLDLAARLARESGDSAGFSPLVLAYFAAQSAGVALSVPTLAAAGRVLLAVFAGWLLWRAWRGRPALRGAADAFLGYLLTALSFRIWYSVWPFPWLLLDGGRTGEDAPASRGAAAYRLRAGLWLLLTAQLSVVIYGHVRVYLLGGSQPLAHAIGVPFVFLLPWLLALLPLGPLSDADRGGGEETSAA